MAESNLGTGGAQAINGASPPAPIARDVSPIVAGNDSYNIDALKAFSEAETAEFERQNPELFKPKPSKKEREAKRAEVEPEEIAAEDTEDSVEGEVQAEEASDESSEEKEEKEVKEPAEDEAEEISAEEAEKIDHRKYVVAKDGEKSLKIPKQALVDIKIDGKIESLPLKEVLNRASGAVHIEREASRIGRERKALEVERAEWREKAENTKQNMETLQELIQNAGPEEVAAYFAHLKGEDPNVMFNSIIQNALKYAEQFEGLTEREVQLLNENRKYKLDQFIASKRAKANEAKQAQEAEKRQMAEEAKRRNVTSEDWNKYSAELLERMKSGELDREISSPKDVFDYIDERKREMKVEAAIGGVQKSLLRDSEFKTRVAEAVVIIEATRKRVMSPEEVKALVRHAAELDKKALSDTLNQKASRAVKSGFATSQNGKSPKPKNDEGPLTLRDHWDKLRGT